MILDGRFLYPGNGVSPYLGRPPSWMPLAVFATAALAISSQLAGRPRAGGSKDRLRSGELKFAPTIHSITHAVNVVPDGTSKCWRPSIM